MLDCLYDDEEYQKIPRSHDLLYLAEKAGLDLSDEYKAGLAAITAFNIQARYPDYKKAFYEKCTVEYSNNQKTIIEDVRTWLKTLLPT
jgi:HEPN domain-containing protein